MATINLGSIKFNWKGTYAGGTAYAVDDVVNSSGTSYVCIAASTGNAPPNATYWNVMAQGGTDVGTTLTTQGDILYRDGSGLQRLPKGTAGQVLKMNSGATAPEYGTLASNVEIVNYTTFDGSGANSMSVTTDWTTNNYWKLEIFGQYQMNTDNISVRMRLKNSSGDITSQTYNHIGYYAHSREDHTETAVNTHRDLNGGLDNINLNGWGFNSARINPNFTVQLFKPDPNNRQSLQRIYYNNDVSNPVYHAQYDDTYHTTDTSAKTGFTVYANNSSNKIQNGFIVTLGYKYQ